MDDGEGQRGMIGPSNQRQARSLSVKSVETNPPFGLGTMQEVNCSAWGAGEHHSTPVAPSKSVVAFLRGGWS